MTAGAFAALPPEVNSALIYAGPGTESLAGAAVAWDGVAAELSASLAHLQTLTDDLTNEFWQGPASIMMVSAVSPYLNWLSATAEQARQTAQGVRSAAAAFQAVHAAVVPPSVIAVNRTVSTQLAATNWLGQNTAAIASNEARYASMWAQDVAAMHDYAAASSAAATLAPFTPPPQPADQVAGNCPRAGADGTSAAGSAHMVSDLLQQLAAGGPVSGFLQQINAFLSSNSAYQAMSPTMSAVGHLLADGAGGGRLGRAPERLIGPVFRHWFPPIQGGEPASALMSDVSGRIRAPTLAASRGGLMRFGAGSDVSVDVGRAATVGSLAVPQAWSEPVRFASTAARLHVDDVISSAVLAAPELDYAHQGHQGTFPAIGTAGTPGVPADTLRDDTPPKPAPDQPTVARPPRRATRSASSNLGGPDRSGTLSDHERAELALLRKRVTELVERRDEAADAIRNVIRS